MNNKIKTMTKIHIKNVALPAIIFYSCIIGITVLAAGFSAISDGGTFMLGGMESSSIIFIFICFCIIYSEGLKFSLQNSVSRKTYIKSLALGCLLVGAAMGAIDTLIQLLGTVIATHIDGFAFVGTVRQIYGGYMGNETVLINSEAEVYLSSFVFNTCAYALVSSASVFVASIFYRLGKLLRIIIIGGAGIFIFVGVPILTFYVSEFFPKFFESVAKLVSFAFGIYHMDGSILLNPYYACVTFILLAALFSGLYSLVIRKTQLKARA